jgi:3-oxoacyl-[acyl-carrier protein] reductase
MVSLAHYPELSGQSVLITGASSGIGAGLASAFAAQGCHIAVNYPDISAQSAAENIVNAIDSDGGNAIAVQADVSRSDEVAAMMDVTLSHFGKLDILVNNAGIARSAPVQEISEADWDLVMAVHVKGTFLCTRAALPHMLERDSGRIISTTSQLAYKGAPGFAHYTAAKGAILSFMRTLALEIGAGNITANCVAPGATLTPILEDVPADILEAIRLGIPRGKLAEVEDILGAYLFLASDGAAHFRGQCLSPNGGDVFL